MRLTVIIRDNSERDIHYGLPSFRTVCVELTGQQELQIGLRQTHRIGTLTCHEEISQCILQDYP